ncbi:MAG: HEAT repeat domain-containing protein [Elusimicrobia bacterium]|nr:HEAT repeat domain-containing protein [Elusimicrobiota bacterium]
MRKLTQLALLCAALLPAACASDAHKLYTHDGPEYKALCSALASDPAEGVRLSAAQALANMGYGAANAPLAKALTDDSSADVRRKAAELLEHVNNIDRETDWRQTISEQRPEVNALLSALSSDKDASVRASSARAMRKFRDRRIPPALAQALSTDKDSDVRAAASESLGLLGSARP